MLPSVKAAEAKLVAEGWNGVFQKEYAGITGISSFVTARCGCVGVWVYVNALMDG